MPVRKDFQFPKGSSKRLKVVFDVAPSSPLSDLEYSVRIARTRSDMDSKIFIIEISDQSRFTYDDAALGPLYIRIDSSDTQNIGIGEFQYQICVTNPSDKRELISYGVITMTPTVV